MFGTSRRHRPPNPPLNSRTANPNATSAAASAFMSAANQKPSSSLSSAAAAAALRARPHTPTNVGQVQTKRTLRRSASASSAGSAPAAAASSHPAAQLQRTSSSSSMAERTFRSPSPHRSGSIHAADEEPPVPQIPAGHKKQPGQPSAAVGMQVFRTASQKMKPGNPSWYTEPTGDPSNVRTSDIPMKTRKPQLPDPQNAAATSQRPNSRSSSVNFSYPTAFRAQSPPASPTSTQIPQYSSPPPRRPASPPRSNRASISSITSGRSDQPMVYDPNSRRMVPKTLVDISDFRAKEVVEQQPRKKKYGRTQGEGDDSEKVTGVKAEEAALVADIGEHNAFKQEPPMSDISPTKVKSPILDNPTGTTIVATPGQQEQNQDKSESSQSLRLQDTRAPRDDSPPPSQQIHNQRTSISADSTLGNKSVDRRDALEDVSGEDERVIRPSQRALEALDAVPTRQSIFERPENLPASNRTSREAGKHRQIDRSPQQEEAPTESIVEQKALSLKNKPVVELSREDSRVRRSNSNSPARQAHFSATPSDSLAVRHAPPPRSASPIKSALKRTGPTSREVSPSDKDSDVSGSRHASPQQEENVTRKKSVRVSFDDRTMATVVGESSAIGDTDSSAPPSPQQAKRPWYSNIGRAKRREFALEDDEIMKPRPALPSFGSIRDKKPREPEERPLVRPHDPNHSSVIPPSPELRPSIPSALSGIETPEELSLGQSSDRALGSIFTREQAPRNAPNISRFREPLPPVVTSVEGSGYVSDSTMSSDDDDDLLNSIGGASDAEEFPSTQTTQLDTHDNTQNNSVVFEEKEPSDTEARVPNAIHPPSNEIPEIAIVQPSPRLPDQNISTANVLQNRYFDVPGGFPEEITATRNVQNTSNNGGSEDASGVASSPPPVFEPKAAVQPLQPESLPQTTLATTTPLDGADNESTDDSDTSIYSDAYEDPWNGDGDGFLSLDAVVEKPINQIASSRSSELSSETSKGVKVEDVPQTNRPAVAAPSRPEIARPQDDWEQAKAFWRSLSAEKRLQLEREAMEEAGAEGDKEETERPIQINSGKTTTQRQQVATGTQPQLPTTQLEPTLPANSEKFATIQPTARSNQEATNPPSGSSRMRMSLRGERPGQTTNPRSPDGMRKTMRSHPTTQVNQPSPHRSAQPEKSSPTSSRPTQQQSIASPTHSLRANRIESSLPRDNTVSQRRGSDASDSSFKRARASRGGGTNLRSSMRPSSANPSHDVARGSGRFSLRSLSPSGSLQQSSTINATGRTSVPSMPRTLRSSSVSSQERILSSLHFPSFGRSSKKAATKSSKRSSRFGDSSDEEEAEIPSFRSRFDDSSDEESIRPSSSSQAGPLLKGTLRGSATGAAGFRKATPVPEVEEDSPELLDSDDEMPSPMRSPQNLSRRGSVGLTRSNSAALGTATLTRSRSGRGAFNPAISTPTTPSRERRSSLMGILRRNKRADSTGKIQRSEITESAARRDTRLERSSEQLRDLRVVHSSSPRLQKRNSVKRNENWPLGEPAEGEGMRRSNSAGNLLNESTLGSAQKPELNNRRNTSLGLPTGYENEQDVTVDGVEHRKKKKFGALRRMFGLDD